MKKILALVLVAMLVIGCWAFAEGVPHDKNGDGKLVVYGIYKSGDQEWFLNEGESARKTVEEAGGEFYYVDVALEGQKMLDAIEQAHATTRWKSTARRLPPGSASPATTSAPPARSGCAAISTRTA